MKNEAITFSVVYDSTWSPANSCSGCKNLMAWSNGSSTWKKGKYISSSIEKEARLNTIQLTETINKNLITGLRHESAEPGTN